MPTTEKHLEANEPATFEGEGKYKSQWDAFDDGYAQGLAIGAASLTEAQERIAGLEIEQRDVAAYVGLVDPIVSAMIEWLEQPRSGANDSAFFEKVGELRAALPQVAPAQPVEDR